MSQSVKHDLESRSPKDYSNNYSSHSRISKKYFPGDNYQDSGTTF
jgi:hypothetical protein